MYRWWFLYWILQYLYYSHGYYADHNAIYCNNGNEWHVHGMNWYGMEEPISVMEGLWQYSLSEHLQLMKQEGFNTVRIPFSLDNVLSGGYDHNIIDKDLVEACPECHYSNGTVKTPFDILHQTFLNTKSLGMKIILDLHRLRSKTTDPLWFSHLFTSDDFLRGWNMVLDQFIVYDNLLGIDLYNEPHGKVTFGDNEETDWKLAVKNFYESLKPRLLKRSPEPILLFINGIGWGQDMRLFPKAEEWFIGDNDAIHSIIMSPHAYGPTLTPVPSLSPTYLFQRWDHYFGHLKEKGWTIVIGEWGGNQDFIPDTTWMTVFVDYLLSRNIRYQCFWAWNPNSKDVKGYLLTDWKTPCPLKKRLLQQLNS